MKKIAITGGVGMGKSTVEQHLRQHRLQTIDADSIVKELTQPGHACLSRIQNVFGQEYIDSCGNLKRGKLAGLVFQNESAREELESILHPEVRIKWNQWLEQKESEGSSAAFVTIPLLFETKTDSFFDYIITVACSEGTRKNRLIEKGWSDLDIQGRIQAQIGIKEKMERSDFVIWTEGLFENIEFQLAGICPEIGLASIPFNQ